MEILYHKLQTQSLDYIQYPLDTRYNALSVQMHFLHLQMRSNNSLDSFDHRMKLIGMRSQTHNQTRNQTCSKEKSNTLKQDNKHVCSMSETHSNKIPNAFVQHSKCFQTRSWTVFTDFNVLHFLLLYTNGTETFCALVQLFPKQELHMQDMTQGINTLHSIMPTNQTYSWLDI